MSVHHPTPAVGRRQKQAEAPPRFTSLYRTHYEFVWRCARRLGATQDDVDDVVQETFVVALRRLDEFETHAGTRLSTWLFGILRNVLRNQQRGRFRRARRQAALAELREGAHADASVAEHALALELLDRFLASLDPDQRDVFVLAELEGHDSRAVGQALGINPNTARTRLRAARRAFADTFESGEAGLPLADAIAAGRRHPPCAGVERRERTLRAVAAGGLGNVGRDATLAKLGFDAWAAKLSFASLVLTTVTFAFVVVPNSRANSLTHAPTHSQRVREAMRPHGRTTPAPVQSEAAPAEQPPIVEPTPIEPPAASSASPRERPSSLQQLRGLAEARQAMLDGRPEHALALLRRLPIGDIEQSKRALEIGALCALGRRDEARTLAATWSDSHPEQPLDEQGAAPCW